jgi:hypothetical protein
MDDGIGAGLFVELVFEYFGALCKWIYYTFKAGIVGDSRPRFGEILAEKKRRKRDRYNHAIKSNAFVGFVALIVLVFAAILIVDLN